MKNSSDHTRDTFYKNNMELKPPSSLESIIHTINETDSYHDIDAVLAPFRRQGNLVAVVGAARLEFYGTGVLMPEYEGLKRVESLGLSCAPRIVDFIQKPGAFGVLITEIPGSGSGDFGPELFGLGQRHLGPAGKAALRADLEKLRAAGMWNNALERFPCWHLTASKERVIISPWRTTTSAEPRVIEAGVACVEEMLQYA